MKPDGSWKRVKLQGMEGWDRDGSSWWWGFITDIKFINDEALISSNGNGLFVIKMALKNIIPQIKKKKISFQKLKLLMIEFLLQPKEVLELDTVNVNFKKQLFHHQCLLFQN